MGKSTVQKGNEKSNVSKLPAVFSGIEPNSHLLHLSVLRQLSNQRAGTACTKTRSEVRGGGKKPWKQKGTGRARAGSIRSPLWVGGGITHGPKPRSFRLELTKKARNLAIAQAIVAKADQINTLKSIPEIKDSKTKNFILAMKSMGFENKPALLIASPKEQNFNQAKLASRNIPGVMVESCDFVGVTEIIKANSIAITEVAFKEFEKRFSKIRKKG